MKFILRILSIFIIFTGVIGLSQTESKYVIVSSILFISQGLLTMLYTNFKFRNWIN